MDLFDCVAPTRTGRHGTIYTKSGILHTRNGEHKNNFTALNDFNLVKVPALEGFTLAYVSHLMRSNELLGSMICSLHNEAFILALVSGARQAILDGLFDEYRAEFVREYYQ